ncbi:hypothetical protein NQ318_009626 [Aromia moschata]|uniref:Transposase n=1 Tax=Aromia moschata TaxID=1265417 RepID=A0AAV8Y8Y8_9CUCU|nr:hypothetical protein NQ318_009626 [Aromia moschata]
MIWSSIHSVRLECTHEILRADESLRVHFCQWFINHFNNNNVVFEKAWFHPSGYVNSQNMRFWSADNPHFYIETPLIPQKNGVWAAVSRRKIVGPIFFNANIDCRKIPFRNGPPKIITPSVQMLHDDKLQEGYIQQDGSRAHTTKETINYIDT